MQSAQPQPQPPGLFKRFTDSLWAGVTAIPRIIMWSVGFQAASSAAGHFFGSKYDVLGADETYNTGGMGEKILTHLKWGIPVSVGLNMLSAGNAAPTQGQQVAQGNVAPPSGLPTLPPGTQNLTHLL